MSDSAFRPISDPEWDDLLRQLHQQPKARPRPFFYHRVHARLADEASAKSQPLLGWLRRPAYTALLGALVLALSGDGPAPRASGAGNRHQARPAGPPPLRASQH